eukprot:364943-Chlamydomonas_euryale.AAC.28
MQTTIRPVATGDYTWEEKPLSQHPGKALGCTRPMGQLHLMARAVVGRMPTQAAGIPRDAWSTAAIAAVGFQMHPGKLGLCRHWSFASACAALGSSRQPSNVHLWASSGPPQDTSNTMHSEPHTCGR